MKPYYQDEWVTIYHGDCLETMSEIEDGSMDILVTDPPYNIGKKYGPGTNDKRGLEEYWQWFDEVFSLVSQKVNTGYFYISHSDKGIYTAKPELEKLGLEYIQTLIWWGRNGYSMQLHRKSWSYRHEPILFFCKGDPDPLLVGDKGMWYTSVIEVPRPQSNFSEGRYHPTQKPVNLYKTLIQRTPGKVILDPFMGSGTSLIAAKGLERKAIGLEIEEEYCEIAAKRCVSAVLIENQQVLI